MPRKLYRGDPKGRRFQPLLFVVSGKGKDRRGTTLPKRASQNKREGGYGLWQMLLLIRSALIFTLFLLPAGCQRRDDVIAGITIPIPAQMKKIPDKVFEPIPGFKDGQASYEGKMAPGEILTFYQENMEARGWKPTTFMGGQKDQITYTKNNRACLVWYAASDAGTTALTIMVGTLKPPV